MIQSSYTCRRNINIGGILLILVVTSICVAMETEIVDVWRPTTKFNFDWTLVNWYQFASANKLPLSQNNDSLLCITLDLRIPIADDHET